MVYYAAQIEGQHVSLSALDRRCAHLFFYWDVVNIFLGALFGGTVLAELKTFLQDPAHIWWVGGWGGWAWGLGFGFGYHSGVWRCWVG